MTTPLPVIKKISYLTQLHTDYCNDFENLFQLAGNGSLRCTNQTVALVTTFTNNYTEHFRQNDILMNNLVLTVAGKDKLVSNLGQIDIINDNKVRFMRLYGAAFQVYVKSCRFLDRQPAVGYFDAVLVKWED